MAERLSMFISQASAQEVGGVDGPGALGAFLPIILIFVVLYFLLIRPQRRAQRPAQRQSQKSPLTVYGYGGRDIKVAAHEPTRLALATVILRGPLYRLGILSRFKNHYQAHAPEFNLDVASVYSLCKKMQRREAIYGAVLTFCLSIILVSVISEWTFLLSLSISSLSILVVLLSFIFKTYEEWFTLAKPFAAANFAPPSPDATLSWLPPTILRDLTDDRINVVVYKGFLPFGFAGEMTSTVSFAVNLTRGCNGRSPQTFKVAELYEALTEPLTSNLTGRYSITDIVLVSGQDVSGVPLLLPDKYARPLHWIDPHMMSSWIGGDDPRVRHYKWIRKIDWGGDLVVSVFLRFFIDTSSLFGEIVHCVLTPTSDYYRFIDRVHGPLQSKRLQEFIKASAVAPVATLVSLLDKLNLFAGADRTPLQQRQEIESNPFYDYGAEPSERAAMASRAYLHYFQKSDTDFFIRSSYQGIFDATIDFLEAHDIDVSTLKENRTTIINSGVLVQGGDVTAQSLAVGERASVKTTIGSKSSAKS